MRYSSTALGFALCAAGVTSIGCSTDDRHVERTRTANGEVVVAHDRVDSDDARDRISRDIPGTAEQVKSVNGRDNVTYRPDRDGILYVYNSTDRRLIWSGNIERDQRFVLDPTDNRISIDGRKITDARMNPDDNYRLYFDPRAR